MIKIISTDKAPQAIGPYSQGVQAGDFIFLSGQIPINPQTGELVEQDITLQTRQVMNNIKSILESEGLTLENIVKTTIFVSDLDHFTAVNKEYSNFLGNHRPARSTVEVSRLPKEVLIEIEVIAVKSHA